MDNDTCTGFCSDTETTTTAVVSVPSAQNDSLLNPQQAVQNDVFLSAFFLPLAFYLLGRSKGILLSLFKRI